MSAQFNAGTDGARVHFRKARGTRASPTTIVTGDNLGRLVGAGYDGTSYLEMASIYFASEGTIATNRVPTNIQFWTATNAGPSVPTEGMRLDSSQVLSLNTLKSYASSNLVLGTGTFGASVTFDSTTGVPTFSTNIVQSAGTWTATNNTTSAGNYVGRQYTDNLNPSADYSSIQAGSKFIVNLSGTHQLTTPIAVWAQTIMSSTGANIGSALDPACAILGAVMTAGTTNVGYMAALFAYVGHFGSGTVTKGIGLHIATPDVVGTMTDTYGIYIRSQNHFSGGTQTNHPYSLYAEDGILTTQDTSVASAVNTGALRGIGWGLSGTSAGPSFLGGALTLGGSITSTVASGSNRLGMTSHDSAQYASAGAFNDSGHEFSLNMTGSAYGGAVGADVGNIYCSKPITFCPSGYGGASVFTLSGAALATGSVQNFYTTASVSKTTGSFVNGGGLGNAGDFYNGGAATITGLVTATAGLTTGAGVTNAAGTWKLGALRTGVALVASTTQVIQLDVGGTLWSVMTCSTNP